MSADHSSDSVWAGGETVGGFHYYRRRVMSTSDTEPGLLKSGNQVRLTLL